MPSKYFKNFYERKSIPQQLAALSKAAATSQTGKVKNMKAQFSGAKKKSGTQSGGQRGS